MKKILTTTLLASTLLLANENNAFVTHTELGYIKTDGNTQTETFNLDAKATKNFDLQKLAFSIDAQYASNDDIETKNRYTAELNYGYEISSDFALDYLLGYKDDKFSGFESRLYTGPGVKYKALALEKHALSLEANILYSKDEPDDLEFTATGEQISYPNSTALVADPSKTIAGESDEYTSYRAGLVYDWQIVENIKFLQELSYRASLDDSENYFVLSKTAFTSKLTDILSAGVSYKIDYTNQAALGKERADKTFTFNIILDF